jgi:hypothetical protein
MKVRMGRDSLRFRLTKSEVAVFQQQGWVQETLRLGPGDAATFCYRVEAVKGSGANIHCVCGSITITTAVLPFEEVTKWANTAQVGIYFRELWGLNVAIEKDFRCLDEEAIGEQSDYYDNPKAARYDNLPRLPMTNTA